MGSWDIEGEDGLYPNTPDALFVEGFLIIGVLCLFLYQIIKEYYSAVYLVEGVYLILLNWGILYWYDI